MNVYKTSPLICVATAMVALLLLAACSPVETSQASSSSPDLSPPEESPSETASSASPRADPAVVHVAAEAPSPAPQDMVAFEGNVFVATTPLVESLWETAGWRVSSQPVDMDPQELPPDCTLYPHQGVADQWVGRCQGYILVPQAGADHIAVVVTTADGSTSHFQVAPPPGSP